MSDFKGVICPQFSGIHYSALALSLQILIKISKRFIEKYIVSDIDLPLKYRGSRQAFLLS